MLPSPKSHHMCWSGQLPLSNTFKCSSSVVEPVLCSGKPKVVGPERRVTRTCRSSVHVDQECFKCSLSGGQACRLAPLREI